jgi:hypothetical protein
MSLYGRLNAYISIPSAAIILIVYAYVSRLPRVSSQGVALRIRLEDSVRCLLGRELHVSL